MNKFQTKKTNFDYIKLIPFVIIVMVLMLSIGFSSINATLAVDGSSVSITPQTIMMVTGIVSTGATNNGVAVTQSYDVDSISGDVTLPAANSKVSYNVQIRNIGNTEMAVSSIVNSNNNLAYTINNYTVKDRLCDDYDNTKCTLGSVTTINITIGWESGKYNANSTTQAFNLDFNFDEVVWVASIGQTFYARVQGAVDSAPTDHTLTTIDILENVAERITVISGQNINFNIGNHTLTGLTTVPGSSNGAPVIETEGDVTITNGTIVSAAGQGALNVHSGGTLTMTGGTITATGSRQALYNNGGTVSISGTAYLSATSNERGTVQNLNNGSLTITGGTIVSQRYSAIVNEAGTLVIGVEDGNVGTTTPVIQGSIYGVCNSLGWTTTNPGTTNAFSFFDGIIKGKTGAILDDSLVTMESGYGLIYGSESISGNTYNTVISALISNTVDITFDHNDGTGNTTVRSVPAGSSIGAPPVVTSSDYVLVSWNTAPDGSGTTIDSNTVAVDGDIFYGIWVHKDDYYEAKIGTSYYDTFAKAVAAVPAGGTATITLNRSAVSNVTIDKNKNITLNLQTYTLSSAGDAAVIVNKATCTLISGTIYTKSKSTSAVNNDSTGNFTISGGTIEAHGKRQAIYNNGGRVTISGTAQLSAESTERAAVHNYASGGTITILGGTIISTGFSAVNNAAGTMIIGDNDGTVDTTTPTIRGANYGLLNTATLNFYDGIIMGLNGNVSGTITSWAPNTTPLDGTYTLGQNTYITKYLG